MGSCFSSTEPEDERAAKQRTQEIDRRLEEDYRQLRREVKILLLGSGESGKSTVRSHTEMGGKLIIRW